MIEILVALTLAAIAIIGIMALYLTETKAGGFSRHSTEATVLAEDKIESLRSSGPMTAVTTTETLINERGIAGGIFTRTTTETPVGITYATISVQVQWSDDGFSHSLTVNATRDP